MFRNYIKIAWRSLLRNKISSFINIGGLAVGMAVAMLIGLWIWDELSFNKYHENYERIAQIMQNQRLEESVATYDVIPILLADELRTKYKNDFEKVVAYWSGAEMIKQVISSEDKSLLQFGGFAEAGFPEMMSLQLLSGKLSNLQDPSSVFLSKSLADALFGKVDPMRKVVKLCNQFTLQVAGVYKDLPANTRFKDLAFVAPIELLFQNGSFMQNAQNWQSNSFQIYVQSNPNTNFTSLSSKIKNLLYENNQDPAKPWLFLHPMSNWHLYSEWKNGVNTGGRIIFVRLFGIIGAFVLLLACINFMNLSTARSEKRAKEVGIRKTIGSGRYQLIGQFFSESFLTVAFAFIIAVVLVELLLPWFNTISNKEINILWRNPWFWLASIGFTFIVGLLAGSYPAFYLSSFQPIKVLKGSFRVGRLASIPRKVLVVLQFTVSISLMIGTVIVFRQIQFAKNRPIGYSRKGLITIPFTKPDIQTHYNAFQHDLIKNGAALGIAQSSNPITDIWSDANNLDWKGKDPNRQFLFGTIAVSADFGKVVNWEIKEGRDFSSELASDSLAFILNEAAVQQIGLQNPLGENVKWHGKNFTIIGVVKNMVMTSPYQSIAPTVFMMNKERSMNIMTVKMPSNRSVQESLSAIENIFKKYYAASPFEFSFVDEDYTIKFSSEQRIGKLASFFAVLAIFISCLGLFGLASFIAEQRTKEIGVRKVLGASILNIWSLLSKEFVILVMISLLIASPLAYYFMNNWIQNYNYRTEISWWIFVTAGAGALLITLLTISFQAIRAAVANPVESLKNE